MLNIQKMCGNYCTGINIPLIYASSAATYGNGELGYDDDDTMLGDLKPFESLWRKQK